MKFFDILASANSSLLRNKPRTALTVIAIFIGATTLSLTNGIGSGIKSYLNSQVGNLGNSSSLYVTAASKSPGFGSSTDAMVKYTPGEKKIGAGPNSLAQLALTDGDITKIKAEPKIVSAEPSLNVMPDFISSTTKPDDKFQFTLNQTVGASTLDMSTGAQVSNKSSQDQVTLPSSYLKSLGFSDAGSAVGQQVILGISDATGQQTTYQATVVGVQQKSLVGSTAAYANDAIFKKLYNTQTTGLPDSTKNNYASVAAVFADGLSDAQIQTIKSDLKTKGYDAKTVKDQVGTVFTVISAITYVFDAFAAITLVAAAFGIVNTLYMSVQERTKEIGLMKALGMSKQKIFTLFSIEAVLIGFWGSMLGIAFANILGKIINAVASKGFLKDFTGLHLLSFPASASAIIVGGIVLIALLAGTLPARRASQKDPIEALRYE